MPDIISGRRAERPVTWPSWAGAIAAAGLLAAAALTRVWALSAVSVGLLFGFLLQKGDLCGASAFSEVLLMRNARKLFGLWVGIVVAMIGFAAAVPLAGAALNPKPLLWVNLIAGGLVFGFGTVLAGGCIAGCLYKSATGNLNSIVALLTIPAGVAFVEHGPLAAWAAKMKAVRTTASGGGPVTLPSLSGLPFWGWALIFAGLTGLLVFLANRKHRPADGGSGPTALPGRFSRFLRRPWKPWQAGIGIGLVVVASLFSSAAAGRNYPIGVTHGVLHVQTALTDAGASPGFLGMSGSAHWLILVVLGTFGGAFASASLAGRVRLQPKPPGQVVTALFGGFLVGAGASLATGCVVGNIMSGWSLMSVGMLFFAGATILGNWTATYFYLMGGALVDLPATLRAIFAGNSRKAAPARPSALS